MRYGFYLPTRGQTATAEDIEALVRRGEALGFASVMVADHIVFPSVVTSKYPYTVSGVFPGQGDALEQLALMAFIAGVTERLRLVSSVMILPYRNPVATAKTLATIDVLSRGRVTVGVGVGWLREEFVALDAADFDRRGAVVTRTELMERVWGYPSTVNSRTVDTHVAELRRKLEGGSGAGHIVTVRKLGYRLRR